MTAAPVTVGRRVLWPGTLYRATWPSWTRCAGIRGGERGAGHGGPARVLARTSYRATWPSRMRCAGIRGGERGAVATGLSYRLPRTVVALRPPRSHRRASGRTAAVNPVRRLR